MGSKNKPKSSGSSSFSLLGFFRRNNNSSSTGASTSNNNNGPLSSSSSTSHAPASTSSSGKNIWKGKDKSKDGGSLDDPVVISDDDDDGGGAPRKRRKVNRQEDGLSSARVNGLKTLKRDSQVDDISNGHLGSDSDEEIQALDSIPSPVHRDAEGDPAIDHGTDEEDDSLVVCLVCNTSLRGMTSIAIQEHVNACLDSDAGSSRTTPRPPAPPRPITSITHSLSRHSSPPPPTGGSPNAFSVLMNGHKEKEMWKDAESTEKRDGRRNGPRKAPFYKILTGMPIAVDAFCYGAIPKVTAYFLTHAHSDHYTSMNKSWKHGPIYCSHTTANLIIHMLGVDPQWVHGLPDDVPYVIPETGGVSVTLLEANHCPGSSLFLFEGPQTVNAGDSSFKSPFVGSNRVFRYLHCGDFRACPKHVLHPAVARERVDTVYLDTTYLNPQYCFPPQPLVIEACAALARRAALGADLPTEVKPEDEDADMVDNPNDAEDIKPDIDEQGEVVIPRSATNDAKPDIKPDLKPDFTPHPAEVAFAAEERSAQMMEGWLVKKESSEQGQEDVKPTGRTVVLIGTYSIGKERIVKGVARALGSRIYCDPRKRAILMCQDDKELHEMLDDDPINCQVHLVSLNNISLERLQPYLEALKPHFDRVLAFRPTGWTYRPPAGTNTLPDVNFVIRRDQGRGFSDISLKPIRGSSRQFMMFGVPYSEHSSFFELTCFALSVPGVDVKIIATVNVHTEQSRLKMRKWFEKWAAEKSKRKERGQPAIVQYRDETYW